MKNKTSYVLLLLLIPAFSFAQGFVIKGKVPGIISGYARIEAPKLEGSEEQGTIPEKVRIVNGEFELKGKLANPELVTLFISTKQIPLFLENTNYRIESEFSALSMESVKGGALNSSWLQFQQWNNKPEEFIRKYPADDFSAWVVKRYFGDKTEKVKELLAVLTPAVQGSYFGRKLQEFLKAETAAALTGKPAPASVLTGPDGKQFSWDRFAGKYLVVDFWASWCAPCRMFIPSLTKIYQTYSAKGVEFISVSVDEKSDKWKQAVDEEKMPWHQALGQLGFSEEGLRKAFNFDHIPYMVIIGPDGKVVSELDFYKKEKLTSELDRLLSGNK